jgi:hypothetical protein
MNGGAVTATTTSTTAAGPATALDSTDAVRAVLQETLTMLRAALELVVGDDDASDYGLGEPS